MQKWHFIDETERRKWQNPEAILGEIGLKTGLTFIDIGCGNGFFTLPAARMVGAKGQVYGIDIDSEAIDEIKNRAVGEHISNITLKTGKAEDIVLCQACASIVFFGTVLHDFENPAKVLENAHKMLTQEGILANLDWKKFATESGPAVSKTFPGPPVSKRFPGPPLSKRFDEATASRLIESKKFKIISISPSGPDHYLIIAKK